MINFAQFQASAVETDDVVSLLADCDFHGETIPAIVYLGKLYITPLEDGQHSVLLDGHDEPVGTREYCELRLFAWAAEMGYLEHVTALDVAIKQATLDGALKVIMDALGITTGDVAAQVFSAQGPGEWLVAESTRKANMLASWLRAELAQVTE